MVSIAKRTGTCQCGKKGRYGVWGRYYCKECFIKYLGKDPDKIAEEGGKGNSGMLMLSEEAFKAQMNQRHFMPKSYDYPQLVQVPKGDKLFATLYLTHYPESKGIVGRSICYLIIWKERVYGIIGGNSPPYSVKPVDEYFNITKENRTQILSKLLNNEVFRIIRPQENLTVERVKKFHRCVRYEDRNLGSMVLKEFRYRIKRDYKAKYGEDLIGFLTFVDSAYMGTVYKADNWEYLGMTKGYGTTRRGKRWFDRKWVKKEPKLIFAYKYR